MIVVLDANVLVSGALNPFDKPAAILRLVIEGLVKPAYDGRIMAEYEDVLNRPKFPFSKEQVLALLDLFMKDGRHVTALPLSTSLPDENDEMLVEVALAAQAEALITGNKAHFPGKSCTGVKIYSPDEFLEFFTKRPGNPKR